MASRLVVLVILASAQDCVSTEVVVGAGKNGTVYHKDKFKNSSVSETLCMQHGIDFEGVIVDVTEDDGTIHEAWFPLDNCCQDDNKWQEMQVKVSSRLILRRPRLEFNLRINTCSKTCLMALVNFHTITFSYITELSIVAQGSSTWRSITPLTTCLAPVSPTSPSASPIPLCVKPSSRTKSNPNTRSRLLSTLGTTSSRPVSLTSSAKRSNYAPLRLPTVVVAAIGLVVMVVVAAVVVLAVVFCRMREPKPQPAPSVPPQPAPSVPPQPAPSVPPRPAPRPSPIPPRNNNKEEDEDDEGKNGVYDVCRPFETKKPVYYHYAAFNAAENY